MTFNDLFILQHPQIHTISCGASKPEDFDEHVRAVELMEDYNQPVRDIKRRLDETLESVVDTDWAHHYAEGLPDWSQTPGELNIPVVLWLWNLIKAFDMTQYAKDRFNLMGNAEHWFPGCKPQAFQQIDRDQLRASLKASPYADLIIKILEETHDLLSGDEVKRLSQE